MENYIEHYQRAAKHESKILCSRIWRITKPLDRLTNILEGRHSSRFSIYSIKNIEIEFYRHKDNYPLKKTNRELYTFASSKETKTDKLLCLNVFTGFQNIKMFVFESKLRALQTILFWEVQIIFYLNFIRKFK